MTNATPPLRVLLVSPFAQLGGQERWLLELLDRSPERLDARAVLLEDGPLVAELAKRGISVQVLPTGAGPASLTASIHRVRSLLRRHDAEVVLANGVKAAAVAAPAAALAGVPVVWAKHDFSFDGRLARPLARIADRVIATSETVAAACRRPDTDIVPPPRPSLPAGPEEARRFWADRGLPVGVAPVLAMVGRLVPYKGVDTAIRALAAPGAATWHLAVVGADDPSTPGEQRRLAGLAERLRVRDRVHFLGEVHGAGRHLASFDAVAVLTRRDSDGFGLEGYSIVALEALTAQVPLLGASGNPEVMRMAEAAGVVVASDAPHAVAAALGALIDEDARERAVAGARDLLAGHPDAEECTGRVVQVLAEAARRPGAGLVGPPITVLTCLKNESGHVDGVVGGVLSQLGPRDEYLVLDDGSTDTTPEEIQAWASRDDRIRVLGGPSINLSAARNAGFAAASNAIVACTDAGCEPRPGWLDALRAPFLEAIPVDLVVGVYSVSGGSALQDALAYGAFPSIAEARRPTPWVRAFWAAFGRSFSAGRLDGRSMAVSVDAWKEVGGFDQSMYSSEDAAFGDAVLATGRRSALTLDAEVVWEQGPPRELITTYRTYGRASADAGHWRLVGRDMVRASAYVVTPVLARRGGGLTRAGLLAGAAAYLSLPLARAVREGAGPSVLAAMPVVLVGKDVAKVVGSFDGLLARARRRLRERAERR